MSAVKQQPLGCGITVFTNDVHKFGTDAVLLADFAAPTAADSVCDLGTGCGIIPLLWCRTLRPKKLTAVDIQPDATELLHRSAEKNGLDRVLDIRCADLRDLPADMAGQYTLVTMNPPYKRVEGGLISPNPGRAIARHELKCTVEDMAQSAARLLKPWGRLCVCHRPERLSDLICAMRDVGIEPKRLRFVCQRAEDEPMLVLCEGRRGGAAGMTVDAPFIIEDGAGEYSEPMRAIYALFERESEQK